MILFLLDQMILKLMVFSFSGFPLLNQSDYFIRFNCSIFYVKVVGKVKLFILHI